MKLRGDHLKSLFCSITGDLLTGYECGYNCWSLESKYPQRRMDIGQFWIQLLFNDLFKRLPRNQIKDRTWDFAIEWYIGLILLPSSNKSKRHTENIEHNFVFQYTSCIKFVPDIVQRFFSLSWYPFSYTSKENVFCHFVKTAHFLGKH